MYPNTHKPEAPREPRAGVRRAVVMRICEELNVPEWKSNQWFDEMLKFLALSNEDSTDPPVPSRPVDVAWHNFILLTRPYAEYCLGTYGQFLHHDVELDSENPAKETGSGPSQLELYSQTRESLRARYGDVDPEIWPAAIDWTEQSQSFQQQNLAHLGEVVQARFSISPHGVEVHPDDYQSNGAWASEPLLVALRRLFVKPLLPTGTSPLKRVKMSEKDQSIAVLLNLNSDRSVSIRISSPGGFSNGIVSVGPRSGVAFDAATLHLIPDESSMGIGYMMYSSLG